MKDLDFDELDRAVNSLINPADTPPTPKPTVSIDTPAPSTPVDPVTAPAVPAREAPQSVAARRSSGRFMDVVHPSSDMRTATPTPRPTQDTTPARVVEPAVMPAATPPVQTPSTGAWPDPIDFSGLASKDEAESDEDIDTIADSINHELSGTEPTPADPTPLESPFLTNTKVEKRPLGAFSEDAPVTPVMTDEPASELSAQALAESEMSDDGRDSMNDHPMGDETPLPAELQDELVSIESDKDTVPVVEAPQPAPAPALDPVSPGDAPVAPVSIVQQYTEQASTGDQPAGSIFDTEAYKKPLAHPKKKKSGWLLVLWIFLLLVIGAGAGAAVYFYVLPLLGL